MGLRRSFEVSFLKKGGVSRAIFGVSVAMSALVLPGCSGPSLWEPMVQSNFVYPNSNIRYGKGLVVNDDGRIVTGKPVSKKTTDVYPFWSIPDFKSAARVRKVSDEAMAAAGQNLIVDGSVFTETTNYFLFWTVSVTVSGLGIDQEPLRRDLTKPVY